jgi:hypothetical protein
MAKEPKNSSLNPAIDKALQEAMSVAEDFKERMMAINSAIKWEAVKLKASDDDFGGHFLDEDEGVEDEQ